MAKHKYEFDEKKIQRFHKEKRGEGHGAKYKPWLTIQDVPSSGRSSRIYGFTAGRLHHLLSDIERDAFVLFDWSDSVTDVREQFPLDRDVTRKIATEMGVSHPTDPKTRVDIVMTTDLVVDARRDGGIVVLPRTVKPFCKLDDRRVLEKLEIERRYWLTKGMLLRLITERDCPEQRVKNLLWIREMGSLANLEVPYPAYWDDRCRYVLSALNAAGGLSIELVFRQLEQQQGFSPGEALTALRHLLATKAIGMNLDEPFEIEAPVSTLIFPSGSSLDRRVA